MSAFWQKFKGIFLEEIPQTNQSATNSQPAAAPTPSAQEAPVEAPKATMQAVVGNLPAGAVSEKFMEKLFGAMEKANTEGFDYFEFKQALANLQNVPMDEATRYKSAFAMAQTMGASADKLIQSGTYYLDILKKEETQFLQAAEKQRQTQVGNREAEFNNLEATIQQKEAQIQQLQKEIEAHRAQMAQMKDDMAQSAAKVEQTISDFEATFNSLYGQIDNDVRNLKNYLK